MNDDAKVMRTVHLKFAMPAADPGQLLMLVKAATPFYEMLGGTRVRLLQNADDPARFIQVIEYEAPASMELNRQRFASDPRLQTYLQAWRTLVPGAIEVDVYQEVAT